MRPAFALFSGAALFLTGCVIQTNSTPPEHDYKVLELDSTKSLTANIVMGAGNLRIGSGTEKLLRADFDYSRPSWKPEFRYANGNLTIAEPETNHVRLGTNRYDWDLRFNRDVPLDLHVQFGAAKANLDLGSLDLRRVGVEMGVGTIQMDLRGQVRHDYDVSIQGGVGECTVYLPSDVGVYAEANGGIGEIRADGLHKEDNHYFNDAYQKAKYTIRLNIQGGVGSIHLISD
jgi:hypothetical protein